MYKTFAIVICACIASLLFMGYSPGPYELNRVKLMPDFDSALIVSNGIRKVKSVQTIIELEMQRYDWDGKDNNPKLKTVQTTWTTFDRLGRVVLIETTIDSEEYGTVEISKEQFVYTENELTERNLLQRVVDKEENKKDTVIERIEIVRWSDSLMWKRMEWEDYGQWIVHIDSTALTSDGKPHITYTYNSMGDSFVEEYVYDAKARLKYRRLAMKQFWSPPWEVESSTYTYHDDGSYVVRDSVFRSDPDMNSARARAGNRNDPGYAWKVLVMAPSTGTFHRLEWWEEFTYDSRQQVTQRIRWSDYSNSWEDYSWSYNTQGQLTRKTEWRAYRSNMSEEPEIGNKDSVWYVYNNGILALKEYWHSRYGETDGKSTKAFGSKDPNRTETCDYHGLQGYDKVQKRYEEDYLLETKYFGKDGLIRKKEGETDDYQVVNDTEYTYFKW